MAAKSTFYFRPFPLEVSVTPFPLPSKKRCPPPLIGTLGMEERKEFSSAGKRFILWDKQKRGGGKKDEKKKKS
ncbi:hypothetical protein CEXT_595601 [Caerostris extrusa]|uniref:Uncharacterized protein n=1 Tax=Caerostris extrusa TaxID=172846 RepID=A0AAV4Y2U8_CAEEX|nr:hypothetical protein CEXT_595601 [Caerostris extrusa]